MPTQKDENGRVTLVVFGATWRQLCKMAESETGHWMVFGVEDQEGNRRNVPTITPIGITAEATFWVCAAMLLGNADAMMLAAISRRHDDGLIWFDGLEVL